jgi:hypothetical protein
MRVSAFLDRGQLFRALWYQIVLQCSAPERRFVAAAQALRSPRSSFASKIAGQV